MIYDNSVKTNTLIKLLNYIKFDNDDLERIKEFAGSPIVGEILEDLISEFYPRVGREFSFDIENKLNESYKDFVIKGVKSNLSKIDNWDTFDLEIKKQIIVAYASPIVLTDNILENLLSDPSI